MTHHPHIFLIILNNMIQETKHQNSGHNGPRLCHLALCTQILQNDNHGNYYYVCVGCNHDHNNCFKVHITYIRRTSFLVKHGNTLLKYQAGVKINFICFCTCSCSELAMVISIYERQVDSPQLPKLDVTLQFSIHLLQFH